MATRWPLHVALASTWVVLAYLIRVYPDPAAGVEVGIAPLDYFRTQLGVTWRYLRLFLWPAGQTLEYDWPLAPRWLTPEVLVPAAGWVAVLALLVWSWRSGRAAAAFWLGFALLALAPSSSVVPIADLAFEHRMYLTVGGCAVLAALAGAGVARHAPRLVIALAALAVGALGWATVARNELWRDPAALWEDALAKAPDKPRAFRQLIGVYEERGDRTSAARVVAAETAALERQRAVHPHDAGVLAALADAYARSGRKEEAFALITEAVQLAPEDPVTRTAYGGMLLQRARWQEAVTQLEVAEALASPRRDRVARDVMRSVRANLGWAYASVGREADAVRILRQAAADDDVTALNNLGSILGRLGQWEEARYVLERAHEREPDDPNVESNLGWVYTSLGHLPEARALLEDAILREPNEPSAHGNLGWVRLRTGDAAGALHALATVQALQPENAWIAHLQGIAHARLGAWRAALEAFARAEALSDDSALARANRERAERREQPLLPGE